MNDISQASNQAPAIKPAVAQFFNKALPRGGAANILTLGEYHTHPLPLVFLRDQLPRLQKDHNLGTIGIEMSPAHNVILWAYQDGTLTKELGSKKAAQEYVKGIFEAYYRNDFNLNAIAVAELAIAALDSGMRVVAYDSRFLLEDLKNEWSDQLSEFDAVIKNKKNQTGIEEGALRAELRKHVIMRRDPFPDGNMRYILSSSYYPRAFYMREIDHWLQVKPEYQARLTALENIVDLGRADKIGGDAISATLLAATSDHSKNTIAIIGSNHINGKGNIDKEINTQGTLPHHLEQILAHSLDFKAIQAEGRPAPQVTRAVMAGDRIEAERLSLGYQMSFKTFPGKIVRDEGRSAITLIDLDKGETKNLPRLINTDARLVDLVRRFPCVTMESGNIASPPPVPIEHNKCINPLLNPETKKAVEEVSILNELTAKIQGVDPGVNLHRISQIVRDEGRSAIPLVDIDTSKTKEHTPPVPKDLCLVMSNFGGVVTTPAGLAVTRFPCVTVESGNIASPPPVPIPAAEPEAARRGGR